jgi:hypothetical protein
VSGHDSASIAALLAGLTADQEEPLGPEALARLYCDGCPHELVADPGRSEREDGTRVARGFCGFNGSFGYDDGYSFMGDLEARGWRPLPSKGDWPYLVYMAWVQGGVIAIAEYCEADLTVWVFADQAAASAHLRTLRDCP